MRVVAPRVQSSSEDAVLRRYLGFAVAACLVDLATKDFAVRFLARTASSGCRIASR